MKKHQWIQSISYRANFFTLKKYFWKTSKKDLKAKLVNAMIRVALNFWRFVIIHVVRLRNYFFRHVKNTFTNLNEKVGKEKQMLPVNIFHIFSLWQITFSKYLSLTNCKLHLFANMTAFNIAILRRVRKLLYPKWILHIGFRKLTVNDPQHDEVQPNLKKILHRNGIYSSLPNKRTSRISVQGGILTENK